MTKRQITIARGRIPFAEPGLTAFFVRESQDVPRPCEANPAGATHG